ncbi:hypothetical protein A3765_10570 [Oleiphilus sp. HI0130]|nr:hypothetical protein A3765_22230 [Oleiphilus sp. HI0130]KZZ75256.1 hypothetical protein A3765_10570 [Oleiphilus sp. HI0130]
MIKELWKKYGTFWLLEEYGKWANQPAAINLSYPKKAPFAQLQGRSVPLPRISDELAGFISEVLNQLGEHRPELKDVVVAYHVRRYSVNKIANTCGIDRKKINDLLHSGEAWVDAKVYDYFRSLEKVA